MKTNIDFVRMAKAQAKAKEKGIDKSLMLEGESMEDFINRVYHSTIWRMLSAIAMADHVIYRLSDDLIGSHPEYEDHRIWMVDYFEKFAKRIMDVLSADEDVILDFRQYICKHTTKKLDSFTNCAIKVCKKIEVGHPETVALICVYLKMADTIREVYTESIKPLGILGKFLPDFIPRAIKLLEWSGERALKIISAIDPENREPSEPDPKLDKLYYDIIDLIMSNELQVKALKFARKENGK